MEEKHGLDKEIADKLSQKYDAAMEHDALVWIDEITGMDLSSRELPPDLPSKPGSKLQYLLKDGVALCRLVNALQPGLIKKFAAKPGHVLEERNNIQQYLVACARLMIPEADLFMIGDLHEAKDMTQVLQNIYAVGRQAQVLEGFEGPRLGVKFTTSLQVQQERKKRRKLEEIFAQEKQIEREEEALHRRRKLETRQLSISEVKYNEEENRATKRRLRRGDTMKEDTHSMRHRRFEVEDVSFGLDAETKEALESKYDYTAEQQVLDWIEILTGETIDYFYEGLRSGVVLCKLLNAIRPGMIKDISTKPVPLMERENIKRYLRAAQAFGLQSFELFVVSDLYDKKNLGAVLTNLRAIARKAESLSTFPGPQLRDIEEGRVSINSINIADTEIADKEHVAETFKKKPTGGAKALQDLFTPTSSTTTTTTETAENTPDVQSTKTDEDSLSKDEEIERLQALIDATKTGRRAKLGEMKKLMEQLEEERRSKQDELAAEEEEIRREEEKLRQIQRESARRRAAFATRSKTVAVEPSTVDLDEEAERQVRAELEAEKVRSASSTPSLITSSSHIVTETASANNSDDEGDGIEETRARSRSVSEARGYQPPKPSAAEQAAIEEADRQERLERRRRHRLAMEQLEQAEEEARKKREAERKAAREAREAKERAEAAELEAAAEKRRLRREESMRMEIEAGKEQSQPPAQIPQAAVSQHSDMNGHEIIAESGDLKQLELKTEDEARNKEEKGEAETHRLVVVEASESAVTTEKTLSGEKGDEEKERLIEKETHMQQEEEAEKINAHDERLAQEAVLPDAAESQRLEQEVVARAEAEKAEQLRVAAALEEARLAELRRVEAELAAREAEEDRLREEEAKRQREEAEREEQERLARLEALRKKRAEEAARLAEEERLLAEEEAKFEEEQRRKEAEFRRQLAEKRAAEQKAEEERKRLLELQHQENEKRLEAERRAAREAEEKMLVRDRERQEELKRAAERERAAFEAQSRLGSSQTGTQGANTNIGSPNTTGPRTPRKGAPSNTQTAGGVTYTPPRVSAPSGSPKGSPASRTRRGSGLGLQEASEAQNDDPVMLDLTAPLGPTPVIDRDSSENTSLLDPSTGGGRRGCPCTIL